MGKIVINDEFCKGCGICISVCPQHLLRASSHVSKTSYRPAELVDPGGKCTGCGLCAVVCPDVAIQVYKNRKTNVRKT